MLVVPLGGAGCGGDGGAGPELPGPPTTMIKISGDNQVGTVGQSLPEPIRVRVTDTNGRVVSGVSVEFVAETGGGSIATSAAPNVHAAASVRVALAVAITDDAGEAEAVWTLGTTAGANSATARIVSSSAIHVSFAGMAQAGPPAVLTTPGMYAGAVAEPLVGPVAVKVRDQYGNAVPDVAVTWQVISGGGTLDGSSSQTDARGFAEMSLTLGPDPAPNIVRASVAGLSAIDVTAVGVEPVLDAVGDLVSSTRLHPDITRFGGLPNGGSLVVYIEFTDTVYSSVSGDPKSIAGYIEIDTDQDPGTGVTSLIDRAGGSTGLGVDHWVVLFADDAGRFVIADVLNDTLGAITGLTTPVFSANSVTIRIFLTSLGGDDGHVNASAILGTPTEATDIVPNQGHIVLTSAGAAGANESGGVTPLGASTPGLQRLWLKRRLLPLP